MDCTRCGKIKPLKDFPMQCRGVGGGHICHECNAKNATRHYKSLTVEQRRVERRATWATMIKDPAVKLRYMLRKRMTTAFRQAMIAKAGSSARVLDYIGCSIVDLRAYLESQFKPGMNWKNNSVHGWHVDHVMPLSGYDLTSESDLKKAWHYTNLRPLWAKENLRKRDKKPIQHQPLLMLSNP
jgi:hypothetical protein